MKKLIFSILLLSLNFPAFAGSVSGTVSFKGAVPETKAIDMNADPSCAAANSSPVYTEEAVVSPEGGLKNVFVYVKTGLEGKTFPVPQTSVALDQQGCHYTPHVFGVQAGQNIEILNSDPTLHNVHGMAKNSKEFNLGMPIKGMKLKRKFDQPEIMVKFKCDVHPWMSAYAGVLEHPYYAVSGADGKFEIKDLPPGTYTLEAWHEKYGTQETEITVTETAATADFSYAG